MASISASSSDSASRSKPEIVCPTSISRTAFVSAAPGISSIITPMDILSTANTSDSRPARQITVPASNPVSSWKNAPFRNTGITFRCIQQTIAPTAPANSASAIPPPRNSVKPSAVSTLPR